MPNVLIKPLRSYEDRGSIRKRGDEPYPASESLAKELEQQGLCEIVGDAPDDEAEPEQKPAPKTNKPSAKSKDA